MRRAGLLETMASGDLEAVTRAVGRGYRPGSVERLAAREPGVARGAGARGARGRDALRRALRGGRHPRALARGGRRAVPRVVARQRRAGRGRGARARGGRVVRVSSTGSGQAGGHSSGAEVDIMPENRNRALAHGNSSVRARAAAPPSSARVPASATIAGPRREPAIGPRSWPSATSAASSPGGLSHRCARRAVEDTADADEGPRSGPRTARPRLTSSHAPG